MSANTGGDIPPLSPVALFGGFGIKTMITEVAPQPYQPIKITITLETEDDLKKWWNLFNHAAVSEFLGKRLNHGLPDSKDAELWDRVKSRLIR